MLHGFIGQTARLGFFGTAFRALFGFCIELTGFWGATTLIRKRSDLHLENIPALRYANQGTQLDVLAGFDTGTVVVDLSALNGFFWLGHGF